MFHTLILCTYDAIDFRSGDFAEYCRFCFDKGAVDRTIILNFDMNGEYRLSFRSGSGIVEVSASHLGNMVSIMLSSSSAKKLVKNTSLALLRPQVSNGAHVWMQGRSNGGENLGLLSLAESLSAASKGQIRCGADSIPAD